MTLWRISNHVSLTGEGGLRTPGRWHSRGQRVGYCADHPASALLEILVHLEVSLADLPIRYRLLRLAVPDDVRIDRVTLDRLPRDWVTRVDQTRRLGDAWLAAARSPLLRVPSAVAAETSNVLLNPSHPDAGRVAIAQVSDQLIDSRLLAR